MAIDWTPWFNVPWHRRAELFSIGLTMFCALILPGLSLLFILYFLVIFIWLKTFCTIFCAFVLTIFFCLFAFYRFSEAFSSRLFVVCIWHSFFMIEILATVADVALGKIEWHFAFVLKLKSLKSIINLFQSAMGERNVSMETLRQLFPVGFSKNRWFTSRSKLFGLLFSAWNFKVKDSQFIRNINVQSFIFCCWNLWKSTHFHTHFLILFSVLVHFWHLQLHIRNGRRCFRASDRSVQRLPWIYCCRLHVKYCLVLVCVLRRPIP